MREELAEADPANRWKRWLIIEAGAKTAKSLAKLNDCVAAEAHGA